jgi:hypothetical protein
MNGVIHIHGFRSDARSVVAVFECVALTLSSKILK